MRFPQVLVYENDGRIAELLRRESKAQRWSLREPRRPEACLGLLRRGGPNVVVLRVGANLHEELALLDRVNWLFPETATIVVGDIDNPVLRGLAWDLGATAVLFPPQQRYDIVDIVSRLLEPHVVRDGVSLDEDESPVGRLPAHES
jgi:DNA-binding response OmpR family regulator